jgi:regulator of protease activity HflC (stomatin/prohibitin superfamily)
MRTLINVLKNQLVLVLLDGKATSLLRPGSHVVWNFWAPVELVRLDIDAGYSIWTPELACVLTDDVGVVLDVPAGHVACLARDGLARAVLRPGRFVLWQVRHEVTAELHDQALLETTVPRAYWEFRTDNTMRQVTVAPHMRGVLHVDGVVERVLAPGRYAFNLHERELTVAWVDLREQELQIVGQEVMTSDKVTLRVNLLLKWRVTDPVRSLESVTVLRDALYAEAQLIARRWVGSHSVDEMLEQRAEAGRALVEALAPRTARWGVEAVVLDLKDVVLPGDMRVILNRVILAQKEAEANLVRRREETAATRSLANTAKVLANNPMLLRLKELEALGELASRVDNLSVHVTPEDLRARLTLEG